MTSLSTDNEETTSTVTDNYIDSKHEYFTPHPQDDEVQIKSVDVWYGIRPDPPQYSAVDLKGEDISGYEVEMNTAWRISKAGSGNDVYIYDREDIAGLRKLLDTLEDDFDRRDMEAMTAQFTTEKDDKTDDED